MPTTMLGLWASASTNGTLSAVNYNDSQRALDRVGLSIWYAYKGGVRSGWTLPATAGKSTVASGQGFVGPVYCRTTASQTISNLAAGTLYIHAITDTSSARDGGLVFTARTTSAAVTNADGLSTGVLLGKLVYNALTGVTAGSADSTLREAHFAYQWKKQTVVVRIPSVGATTVKSAAFTFATDLKFGWPCAVAAQSSMVVEAYNYHSGGFTVRVANQKLAASQVYSQTWTWYGLRGG